MVRGWQIAVSSAAALVLVFSACKGSNNLTGGDPGSPTHAAELANPFPPCTDPDLCCPAESMVILGSPDDEQRACLTLWHCDDPSKPFKCWSALPIPQGGIDWSCTWAEFAYKCEGKTAAGGDVPGGAGWDCVDEANGEFVNWKCEYSYSPNPGNNPAGTSFYECDPNAEGTKLECEPKTGDTPSGGSNAPPTPKTGPPNQPNPGSDGPVFGPWTKTEEGGTTIYKRSGAAPLDDGICTREVIGGVLTLVCFGDNPNPGGQAGWECASAAEFAKDYCTTPLTKNHRPDGMSNGVCTDIIEFGEIVQICEETSEPPNAMPEPGAKCEPRIRRWCDGTTFCGWGIIECKDDGTWPTVRKQDRDGNWHEVEDCEEHPDGLRPDTACAQYYWFFNPECCERTDCIIPEGTNGHAYARSEGKLCDPCSPANPECASDEGALCVYRKKTIRSDLIGGRDYPTGETYCGQQCADDKPCPEGFTCARACQVNFSGGPVCRKQCVPEKDGSCYLRATK